MNLQELYLKELSERLMRTKEWQDLDLALGLFFLTTKADSITLFGSVAEGGKGDEQAAPR